MPEHLSGQGNGLGGCRDGCSGTVLRLAALLAAVAALFVVLVGASCAMAPRETNPPTTVNRTCGETGECEGSATTEHPGCDVPGVAVFDLDGRPICEGRDG
jgi:hypothetical protein